MLVGLATSLIAAEIPISGDAEPHLAAFDRFMLAFMKEHEVPGAALAIARNGRIVYARGFGYADVEKHEPVEPNALFRIASISKPFTAAAIVQLQEHGKLRLDDHPFEMLGLSPILEEKGARMDPRLAHITIRQLLHHTAGFDRDASFDPMFRPIEIAKAAGHAPPAMPNDIIAYMMGRPLDFDPGTREAYSNFGYCVLGRVIERTSKQSYEQYVTSHILRPLEITRMRLGRTPEAGRAAGEVRYYPRGDARVQSVVEVGRGKVPVAYGGWCIEAMDAHGGWIASAAELVRFSSSFDDPARCPILSEESIAEMFRRPRDTGFELDGKPKAAYYACGWEVRPVAGGKANTWHTGLLDGSGSLLVRRHDGLTWAVLFNSDYDPNHKFLIELIDPLLHPVADGITQWPDGREFEQGL